MLILVLERVCTRGTKASKASCGGAAGREKWAEAEV